MLKVLFVLAAVRIGGEQLVLSICRPVRKDTVRMNWYDILALDQHYAKAEATEKHRESSKDGCHRQRPKSSGVRRRIRKNRKHELANLVGKVSHSRPGNGGYGFLTQTHCTIALSAWIKRW